MLQVADHNTLAPEKELVAFCERNIDLRSMVPWVHRSWPGFGTVGLTVPTGFRVPDRVKLNRLHWPSGASRWAYIHLLMSADLLNDLHDDAWGADGDRCDAVLLAMDSPGGDDSANETFSAQMYCLPPTPLSAAQPAEEGLPDTNNLYLLTLVDQRYFWWYQYLPVLNITDSESWSSLLSTVSGQLEVTITYDTVPSEYLNASPAFNLPYEPIPPVLDAVAFNLGMRLVANPDETVALQNATTAKAKADADFSSHSRRTVRAGGKRFYPDPLNGYL